MKSGEGSLHFLTPAPSPSTGLGCRKTLAKLTLPPCVHLHGPVRVRQRRFSDLTLWSEKKRREKLPYLHANPVRTGVPMIRQKDLGGEQKPLPGAYRAQPPRQNGEVTRVAKKCLTPWSARLYTN